MDITISPRLLQGDIQVIPSKSQAHRYLICAVFADTPTQLQCAETNRDIEATADCLNALGAQILRTDTGYTVFPIQKTPETAVLNCCESGSTLRFLLPIVGALGVDTVFQLEGRLPQRPLSPLWEEMERMGCKLSRPTENTIRCTGKLKAGEYQISGSVSSQFITGLLFATSILDGDSTIHITGKVESKPYITMTQRAMALFGVSCEGFHVRGGQNYHSPGTITVEGDWSNGAFWIAAKDLGNDITIANLPPDSPQGDRAIVDISHQLQESRVILSTSDIPDLVPILSVVAAVNHGAVFTDIRRLRLKESDRIAAIIDMIENLGGKAEATEDTLTIHSTGLIGGTVNSHNDHRIAMAAAIAATVCTAPVTIRDAEAVKKSYPKFWDEYARLGGNYEQYLR